jgi:hypothetical protein
MKCLRLPLNTTAETGKAGAALSLRLSLVSHKRGTAHQIEAMLPDVKLLGAKPPLRKHGR